MSGKPTCLQAAAKSVAVQAVILETKTPNPPKATPNQKTPRAYPTKAMMKSSTISTTSIDQISGKSSSLSTTSIPQCWVWEFLKEHPTISSANLNDH